MIRCLLALVSLATALPADVAVDQEVFGRSLGGWKAEDEKAVDYEISGSDYRTFRPHVTPTPSGGIFVSVRIDHRRGWMASPDIASLEVSFGPGGAIESAQSTLGLQGRRITSELIKGGTGAGTSIAGGGIDQAVKIGTELVADLSSKLLREKVVEPGRVTFPAAIRHNYNLLFAAVRIEPAGDSTPPPEGTDENSVNPPAEKPKDPPKKPKSDSKLEIKRFGK